VSTIRRVNNTRKVQLQVSGPFTEHKTNKHSTAQHSTAATKLYRTQESQIYFSPVTNCRKSKTKIHVSMNTSFLN
jgi:hypothetical protein